MTLDARGMKTADIVTEASIRNAMAVLAAFGGSTNLLLHLPAIAYSAGLTRPTVDDWTEVNRRVPRLVDVLPNGPVNHPTIRAYLAGGVPEVMLHLREMGLLELDALTVAGRTARRGAAVVGDLAAAGGPAIAAAAMRRRRPGRRDHDARAGRGSWA